MKRTSITHPLQIAEIPLGRGTIGLTFCPGKIGESVYGDPWDRDLNLDIRALKSWGASMVISLMEEHEFGLLRVPNLGSAIQSAGIEWVHLPIKDVSVPDGKFPRVWANINKRLQRQLARGERIVLHCRGGLGRTGLIAALLLLDHGWAADEAIRTIRKVRPGAIETKEQEAYVHLYLPYLCHASLLGGAIGDSLGADIEFLSLDKIKAKFPNGVDRLAITHAVGPGWFTDDTQMTLFTAEGLIRAHVRGVLKGISSIQGVVLNALLRWYATQGGDPGKDLTPKAGLILEKNMWYQAAPGTTCLSALRDAYKNDIIAQNSSKGCGTIMRVAPVAFGVGREHVRQIAMETSALTHGHPVGQLAAAAWAEILADIISGSSVNSAATYIARCYREDLGHAGETVARAISAALSAPADGSPETVESLGGGWVAEEALSIALYATLVAKDFEDGLRIAVTHSGDSDSTGAIAGNLLGILFPEQVFSHPWAKEIGGRDLISSLALDLPQSSYWGSREAETQFEAYPGV